MNVVTPEAFLKDIKRLRDASLMARLKKAIVSLENARALEELPQVVAMTGASEHFRLRIGDYRLGLRRDGNTVFLMRFLHRKEIYRYFP